MLYEKQVILSDQDKKIKPRGTDLTSKPSCFSLYLFLVPNTVRAPNICILLTSEVRVAAARFSFSFSFTISRGACRYLRLCHMALLCGEKIRSPFVGESALFASLNRSTISFLSFPCRAAPPLPSPRASSPPHASRPVCRRQRRASASSAQPVHPLAPVHPLQRRASSSTRRNSRIID